MDDYYSQLDAIKASGKAYAESGIEQGERAPLESPLSGEWACGVTGQDIIEAIGLKGRFENLEEFEQTDVLDYWEDGYNSAAWPATPDED